MGRMGRMDWTGGMNMDEYEYDYMTGAATRGHVEYRYQGRSDRYKEFIFTLYLTIYLSTLDTRE